MPRVKVKRVPVPLILLALLAGWGPAVQRRQHTSAYVCFTGRTGPRSTHFTCFTDTEVLTLSAQQGGAPPSASASDDVPRVVKAQKSVQQALAELDLEIVNVALVTQLVLWFQVC